MHIQLKKLLYFDSIGIYTYNKLARIIRLYINWITIETN